MRHMNGTLVSAAGRTLVDDRKVGEALTALHRSVSAHQFYPERHPMLEATLKDSYGVFQAVENDYRWEEPGLQLRQGSLWLGDAQIGQTSPAVASLARNFAAHGLVVLRRKEPVGPQAFSHLVALLATSPDVLSGQGGLAKAWDRSPHGAVFELRGLSVGVGGHLDRKAEAARPEGEDDWGSAVSDAGEVERLSDDRLLARLQALQRKGPTERRLLDILLGLGRTDEMSEFLEQLREATAIVEGYVKAERYREAFQVIVYLYREAQNMEAGGQEGKRDYLLDTVRSLLRGAFLQWLIEQVAAGAEDGADLGEYVLRSLGKAGAVPLINALVNEKSRAGRRRLIAVLVAMGDAVVPWARQMLEDQRWFVVRNMVTILGGIASPEAQKSLAQLAGDKDSRIRKEVARAFGRMGGNAAREHLLRFLEDPDSSVRVMAVSAVAAHPSPQVLEALWRVFRDARVGSADWNLKAAVLRTAGRLGMPEAVPRLASVANRRPFFHRKRWRVLRRTAVQALGEVGGRDAAAVLERLRRDRDLEVRNAAIRAMGAKPVKPEQGTP